MFNFKRLTTEKRFNIIASAIKATDIYIQTFPTSFCRFYSSLF